jgi:hypothetical protein
MEYVEIISNKLWIGGAPTKDDLVRLKNQIGSSLTIMDLTRNPDEKKICEQLGVEYDDRTPEVVLNDDNSVPLAKLKTVSAIVADNIDSGRKVVLHCSLGKGRSPTCAAAYLITSGMSLDEAKETMARKGPYWQGADATYMKTLKDLAQVIEMTMG